MNEKSNDQIREQVRERYARVAKGEKAVGCCQPDPIQEPTASCCGPASTSCCGPAPAMAENALGYSAKDLAGLPEGVDMGLGCGNPGAIAALKPGETVLDLGSGGGIDCFLAAKQVGETGQVIGVDMTPDMISKAREAAAKLGLANVDFRLGEIEHLPLADSTVDVIISNCVINLAPDKRPVYNEAFRVLRPGGRLAISDVVAYGEVPDKIRANIDLWSSCAAGAMAIDDLKHLLGELGFTGVDIEIKPGSRELIKSWGPDSGIEEYFASAYIRAVKP